jgi:hypothetical protein
MTRDTKAIRATCQEVGRVLRIEMENTTVSDLWPAISNLIEANCYVDDAMRLLALRHFTDELVRELGGTRRTINHAVRYRKKRSGRA